MRYEVKNRWNGVDKFSLDELLALPKEIKDSLVLGDLGFVLMREVLEDSND